MNKQEALKQIEAQRDMILGLHGWGVFGYIKGIINQLDEPQKLNLPKVKFKKSQKVKVPQFVAEWIEEARKSCKDVADFFEFDFTNDEVGKWFMQERPFDLVARAWLDGYEVEEEKRYLVKVKGIVNALSFLSYHKNADIWTVTNKNNSDGHRAHHTRKELEEADFGWVFDCPGIEIEEVEYDTNA